MTVVQYFQLLLIGRDGHVTVVRYFQFLLLLIGQDSHVTVVRYLLSHLCVLKSGA